MSVLIGGDTNIFTSSILRKINTWSTPDKTIYKFILYILILNEQIPPSTMTIIINGKIKKYSITRNGNYEIIINSNTDKQIITLKYDANTKSITLSDTDHKIENVLLIPV